MWAFIEYVAGIVAFLCIMLLSGASEVADMFWPAAVGTWFGLLGAIAHMKQNPPRF